MNPIDVIAEINRLRPNYQSGSMLDAGRRQMLDHFEQFATYRIVGPADMEAVEAGAEVIEAHKYEPWTVDSAAEIARAVLSAASPHMPVLRGAIADIAVERRRQMEAEGWSPEHDDKHDKGELAGAAACYAMNDLNIHNIALGHRIVMIVRDLWPWALSWWKPTDHRSNLVKAGALIAAEIDRLDRLAAAPKPAALTQEPKPAEEDK